MRDVHNSLAQSQRIELVESCQGTTINVFRCKQCNDSGRFKQEGVDFLNIA